MLSPGTIYYPYHLTSSTSCESIIFDRLEGLSGEDRCMIEWSWTGAHTPSIHPILSHPILSHPFPLRPSRPIQSHPIPFHLISSHLISSHSIPSNPVPSLSSCSQRNLSIHLSVSSYLILQLFYYCGLLLTMLIIIIIISIIRRVEAGIQDPSSLLVPVSTSSRIIGTFIPVLLLAQTIRIP